MTLRLAMWSGPRNISTALMRAWENRGDCSVSDEPLYAAYLAQTGLAHPGREAILAAGDTDWRRVVAHLTAHEPATPVWYQKHMAQHLLPGMDTDWVHSLLNVLLIRRPAEVVASYVQTRAEVAPQDIGLLQQVALADAIEARSGHAPLVIDSADFLRAPEAYLRALCTHAGLAFTPRMLHWPAGPRASDGVWAPHWYAAVWQSTGFTPWQARQPQLGGAAAAVAAACEPAYQRLHARRLVL